MPLTVDSLKGRTIVELGSKKENLVLLLLYYTAFLFLLSLYSAFRSLYLLLWAKILFESGNLMKKNSIAKVSFLQTSFYDFWEVLPKRDLYEVRALFFWPFLFPHFSGSIPEFCYFLKCFSQLCCPQLVIEGKSQCSVQDFRHGTTFILNKQAELGRDGTLVFLGLVCLFMWHALSTKFKVPTYL